VNRHSPRDVIENETWEHAEHTCGILHVGADPMRGDSMIMKFFEDPGTTEGVTRRHRAHVAAAAPELARALADLVAQLRATVPEKASAALASALRTSEAALKKAGFE